MTFQLNELEEIYPENLWLTLSPEQKQDAWKKTFQQFDINHPNSWQIFINCLCQNEFLKWLKCDPDFQQDLNTFPEYQDANFWGFVNGSIITIGETKLVIVPTEKSHPMKIEIPQEWVDIPKFTPHYYLAMQVNLEDSWLRVWGYATHQQIANQAEYNKINKTYCLDREELVSDLNIMWVARELCPQQMFNNKLGTKVSNVSNIRSSEVLLKNLSCKNVVSPRLYADFQEWEILISSDNLRNQLYQRRCENFSEHQKQLSLHQVVSFSQWVENRFTAGWQNVDALLNLQKKTVVSQFRSDIALNKSRVKGAKLIDLGMQLGKQSVVLLVGISPEIDDRISIRVQLYPADEESYLPASMRLALLSQSGMLLQEVISRSHDSYVQLKRFKFPLGKSFSIQMVLGDVNIKEDFILDQLLGKLS
ncbi:DUF1822 family protein [Calothrix sp. PCC 6303]|uniref:DUF1822 family protein n=1 Tax=Calothrix sp. PCC 6303 TaxID=1170562 RepID=UPI0003090678|nr:DUF1822 family protein [Calothrix sp. PCC 6303]